MGFLSDRLLDFLVISVIVGLIVIAIWLYLSTEKEEAKLNVSAFTLPKTSLKTHLVLLPTKSKLLLQKIIEIVWCFGIPILLLAVIALVGYFALTTKNYIYLLIPLSIVIWWCWRIIKWWKNRLRSPLPSLLVPCCPSTPSIGIDAPPRMIKYNGWAYIGLLTT